jgi:2'-5' RNA ligase
MEKIRCFIALDLPREVINQIVKVQELIKRKKLFDGKIIEPDNLHLTLKFLGEINKEQIAKVQERLRDVKFDEFKVYLDEVGVFSSKYKSYIRVLWVKLAGKSVFELQKKIDEKLFDLFDKEKRFMSHITIARIKRVYDRKGFLKYLKQIKLPKICFSVDRFFLKKSELFETGPVYEDIEEYVK